jgi:circadian clock protein KaiB
MPRKAKTKNDKEPNPVVYVLRLYVTGQTPRSTNSLRNLRSFCARHLAGRFKLEVIDIYQQPGLAKDAQIIAAPTLIKRLPLPIRRLVGDLSDERHVWSGLDLKTASLPGASE